MVQINHNILLGFRLICYYPTRTLSGSLTPCQQLPRLVRFVIFPESAKPNGKPKQLPNYSWQEFNKCVLGRYTTFFLH